MKLKELIEITHNVYHIIICEPNNDSKQYHINDVPEHYDEWKVTQMDICYNCDGAVDDDDLIMWIEVEDCKTLNEIDFSECF